jgi:rare lipoprotein A
VRRSQVVAGATLTVALALVAVSGAAGSFNPPNDSLVDPTLFHRVVVASGSVATTYSPDPALTSAGRLDPNGRLIEPAQPAPSRAVAGQDAAPRTVAIAPSPKPLAVGTTSGDIASGGTSSGGSSGGTSSGGWHRDPEVSWYGPGFYGHRTACGKALTTTLLGVANRTLPCGTMITFKNPKNGRTITVPVVDRGPYVAGRSWDLTGATCKALAHCYTGPILWRRG